MIEAVIKKDFGSFTLDVDIRAENEILALLGGSGSGKSMTLRAIAGIVTPDSGRIVVNGVTLFDSEKKINLPPQKRRVGMLFQNYALFPTMTVLQNIMTGVRSGSHAEKRQTAEVALERFQLHSLGGRYPSELSGGQQQRAALARILVGKPRILMLDEPFSALDSHLRDQMEREVMALLRDFGGTTLLVSHSRDEVYRMADRVAIYNSGSIEVLDEKHNVFQDPRTYHAAILTGCKNFSPVEALHYCDGFTTFYARDWAMELRLPGKRDGQITGIRGHDIRLEGSGGLNVMEMAVTGVIEDPFEHVLLLQKPGAESQPIQWMIPKGTISPLPSGTVTVELPPESLMLLQA